MGPYPAGILQSRRKKQVFEAIPKSFLLLQYINVVSDYENNK